MRWVLAAIAGVAAFAVLGVTVNRWVRETNGHDSGQPRTAFVGGRSPSGVLARGCGYLFHDERRWQSISGTWKSGSLRWDKHPAGQGRWTVAQQRNVVDNVTVGRGGVLTPTAGMHFSGGCLNAWSKLPQGSWQRTVARNFKVASVILGEAIA